MAERDRDRDQKRGGKRGGPPTGGKRKSCYFCKDKVDEVDYKNVNQLRRYISEKGKIRSRRMTGLSRRQQALAAREIKRAREMGLLPFVMPKLERARGGGRPRNDDRDDQTMASAEAQANAAAEQTTDVAVVEETVVETVAVADEA